ncbi:response regulator transcription factor [Cytobacillus sp. IB215665]|uniref:response regulator transcription factor n=1 Tax=Cytobacillus sp. IB215665 TaxID=3097357 RepID=UPI002A0DA03D|nr:response regulator transcription factor [Cytobacillus sp. IB215665]MDX8365325.1 response regulator transcription factor [Cytobacillus sp. IB215665]
MSQKILVVDDESNITDVSKRYLEREGYDVLLASNGEEGITLWRSHKPDLIVLDVMMPKKDGWEVCEEIRNEDDVPIIMLTARGEEMDRLMGLTLGADDYMTKPFSPRELVLRVKAIFRRIHVGSKKSTEKSTTTTLKFDGLEIDSEMRKVVASNNNIELTVKEFDMLFLLASHPNQVFSRSQLLDKIWDIDFFGDTTTVTVHIRRLREKIEQNPSEPVFLQTVWGIGYKFTGRELP